MLNLIRSPLVATGALAVLSLALSGCASVTASGSVPAGESGAVQKFAAVAYWPSNPGMYALLEQQAGGDWKLVDESGQPLYPQNNRQEVLYMAREAGPTSRILISTGFPRTNDTNGGGFSRYGDGRCSATWRGNTAIANGCGSRLVKPGSDAVSGIVDAANAATRKQGDAILNSYQIDPDAIRDIVIHSDLLNSNTNYQQFQAMRAEREYEAGWAQCSNSSSRVSCLKNYATRYGAFGPAGMYDPKGHTARARDIVLTRERTNTARIEEQARALRRSLRPGSNTNYGRVLDVKGTSVGVAVALPGFGSEQWVPIEYIYPPGMASAAFYNGQPQRPTLDERLVLGE